MTSDQSSPLLRLPYDIRYLIYQHIFPREPQIYIQARKPVKPTSRKLTSITTSPIPTPLFLVSRTIHVDVSDFLYNTYLFNIVGTKKDCLGGYEGFLKTLRKYARGEVHCEAFSNGAHSNTMAISLHVGEGKAEMLKRRERGVRKSFEEIRVEVRKDEERQMQWPWDRIWWLVRTEWLGVQIAVTTIIIVIIGWMLAQ